MRSEKSREGTKENMFSEQMLTEYMYKSGYVNSIAEGLLEYELAYNRRYGKSAYDEYDFDMGYQCQNSNDARVDMSKLYVASRALVQVYFANDTWDGFMMNAMPIIAKKMELNSNIVEARTVCRLIAKSIYAFFCRANIR